MKTAQQMVAEAKARIREINPKEAAEAIARADLLLDVREADEYAAGHLAGAVNIPRGLVEFKFSATPEYASPELAIVVYCKTSGRAALVACALKEMGYRNVTSILGGYDAWLAEGRPLVTPSLPAFG
ncbi:rhodanese-like domain-containing protein [Crenobacter caeni]|uniref:Sulfurtransferase n=1 Tax=Crenobacter caeni TaxID=2705474 RepID=A0A6B2KRC3_9NEIS|nr:sulfurtransferase [Crenobacter caeni]